MVDQLSPELDKMIKDEISSYLDIQTIADAIADVIQEVRNQSQSTKKLQKQIKQLRKINDLISKDKDEKLSKIFQLYEQLQSISLSIRHLLPQAIVENDYDSINYALYYHGQRVVIEKLNKDWLRLSDNGTLKLNIPKAVKATQDQLKSAAQQKVDQLFYEHYQLFKEAIERTYRKGYIGGKKSGGLNYGHVSEAYEAHMQAHHQILYEYAKRETLKGKPPKNLIAFEEEFSKLSKWEDEGHETIDEAWMHIRQARGVQRGTVAGDVGYMQVKSISDNSSEIRLATANTISQGVKLYSDIIGDEDGNPDVKTLAYSIAVYMTEPLRKTASTMIANIKETVEIKQGLNVMQDTITAMQAQGRMGKM